MGELGVKREAGEMGGRVHWVLVINKTGLQTTFRAGIFKLRFFPIVIYM
jgi:hypothetical protein